MIGNSRKNALYFAKYIEFFQTQISVKVQRISIHLTGASLKSLIENYVLGRNRFKRRSDDRGVDSRQQKNRGPHHTGADRNFCRLVADQQKLSLSGFTERSVCLWRGCDPRQSDIHHRALAAQRSGSCIISLFWLVSPIHCNTILQLFISGRFLDAQFIPSTEQQPFLKQPSK